MEYDRARNQDDGPYRDIVQPVILFPTIGCEEIL